MGEQVTGSSKQSETKTGGQPATRGAVNNSSTTSTSNESGGRAASGRAASGKEKTVVPGLAVLEPKIVAVEVPGEETSDQPKKGRGRPPGSTAKKAASTPAKRPAAIKADGTQIKLMLVTITGIMAARPGMEMWNLSLEEADQLATPLANMMAKNEALGKALGEHADALALVIACFTIFVPKFLMWRASKPKLPKEGEKLNYGRNKPTESRHQEGTPNGDRKPNAGQSTNAPKTNGQNFGGELSGLVPGIAGF